MTTLLDERGGNGNLCGKNPTCRTEWWDRQSTQVAERLNPSAEKKFRGIRPRPTVAP